MRTDIHHPGAGDELCLNPRNKSVEPHAVDVLHRIETLHGENESVFMICSSWNPLNCTRLKFQSGLCIGEDMRTTEPHVGMVFSDVNVMPRKQRTMTIIR